MYANSNDIVCLFNSVIYLLSVEDIYSVGEENVLVLDPLAALNDRKEEEKQSYQNLLRGKLIY